MAKNNKKSFSENLSDIFEYTLNEDNKQDNPRFLSKSFEKESETLVLDEKDIDKDKNVQKKNHRKSFSEGLESFFKDSIEEVIGDNTSVTEVKRGVIKKGKKRAIGIEVLLQSTLFKEYESEFKPEYKEGQPKTKRITFVLDAEKVELLKNVARKEKKEIRQIVSVLIEEYLKEEGVELKKDNKPPKKTRTKSPAKPKK
jgi:hypothetical protein